MKKIKMTNPLPTAAAGMGALGGAVMGAGDAGSPVHMLINAAALGAASAVAGGIAARKERQAHSALNDKQFGKK